MTKLYIYKLRLRYIYTSQDDKITSDALSRCQKNLHVLAITSNFVILTCVYIMKP